MLNSLFSSNRSNVRTFSVFSSLYYTKPVSNDSDTKLNNKVSNKSSTINTENYNSISYSKIKERKHFLFGITMSDRESKKFATLDKNKLNLSLINNKKSIYDSMDLHPVFKVPVKYSLIRNRKEFYTKKIILSSSEFSDSKNILVDKVSKVIGLGNYYSVIVNVKFDDGSFIMAGPQFVYYARYIEDHTAMYIQMANQFNTLITKYHHNLHSVSYIQLYYKNLDKVIHTRYRVDPRSNIPLGGYKLSNFIDFNTMLPVSIDHKMYDTPLDKIVVENKINYLVFDLEGDYRYIDPTDGGKYSDNPMINL